MPAKTSSWTLVSSLAMGAMTLAQVYLMVGCPLTTMMRQLENVNGLGPRFMFISDGAR